MDSASSPESVKSAVEFAARRTSVAKLASRQLFLYTVRMTTNALFDALDELEIVRLLGHGIHEYSLL